MSSIHELERFLGQHTGLQFVRDRERLSRVVSTRTQTLGFPSISSYCQHLIDGSPPELQRLIDSVTVSYTWLFRDPVQFDAVRTALIERAPRPLKVWVPACATGDDAYTIGLIAAVAGHPVEILGTDINSTALDLARRGHFSDWAMRDVPEICSPFLERSPAGRMIRGEIRKSVRFLHHSLVDEAPLPGPEQRWDLIVCRNVFMYLARPCVDRILASFAASLSDDGELFLGSNELLLGQPAGFRRISRNGSASFARASARSETNAVRVAQQLRAETLPRVARLELSPHSADRLHRFEGSVSTVSAGRPREPASTPSPLALGHSCLERGDLEDALRAYQSASAQDPTDAEACFWVGLVLYLKNDSEAAAHSLRAALFHRPELAAASLYLGLCHESSGHISMASAEYRRARSLFERGSTSWWPARLLAWREELEQLALQRLNRTTTNV